MSTAEPAAGGAAEVFEQGPGRLAWRAAVLALVLVAFGLRAWGVQGGLPYVYNADENAHFVPRALGMFGHSLNPDYFINPPGFTYVVHLVFSLWWSSGAEAGAAFAADPTTAFTLGRLASAALGALSVGLLACAGARLLGRGVGLLAGALLAVAFLPAFYAHLALNDAPTLAPMCLCLLGCAGIFRHGRRRDFLLAGLGLGTACATKYTAGVVLLAIVGAALAAPALRPSRRVVGLAIAAVGGLVGFLVLNPYALLDFDALRDGLTQQSEASNDGGGKLGLERVGALRFYLGTLTWGLGWVPAIAAACGAVGLALVRGRRRLFWVLVPTPVALIAFMGLQDRFFARWLLPGYPLLCLLAAWAALALAASAARRLGGGPGSGRAAVLGTALAAAAVFALLGQGAAHTVHGDMALARDDSRQVVRDWMAEHVPEGAKVVVEPVFPDQWAMDPGRFSTVTANGLRWRKWPTSRSRVAEDGSFLPPGESRIVKLEDYERTVYPQLVDDYVERGFCWVVTGSTQYGRAFAEPDEVPRAIAYYRELLARGTVVKRVTAYDADAVPADPFTVPFSFDFSFIPYGPDLHRAGPELLVIRLHGGACGTG